MKIQNFHLKSSIYRKNYRLSFKNYLWTKRNEMKNNLPFSDWTLLDIKVHFEANKKYKWKITTFWQPLFLCVFFFCPPLEPVYEVLSPPVAFFLSKSDVNFGPSEPALPLPARVSQSVRTSADQHSPVLTSHLSPLISHLSKLQSKAVIMCDVTTAVPVYW